MLLSGALQELYSVEHFAFKTVAITFWRLPVIFVVMFLVRGKTAWYNCLLCPVLVALVVACGHDLQNQFNGDVSAFT